MPAHDASAVYLTGTPGHAGGGGGGGGPGHTHPSPYPADGTLPLNEFRKVKRMTLLVDSRDRDYARHPSPSQYVVHLPEALHNVSNAILVSAEFPLTYQVFRTTALRRLTVTVNASVTATAEIPAGNYTFSSMAAALETALGAAFTALPGGAGAAYGTWTVTFSDVTGACTLACAGAAGQSVTVDYSTETTPTGWGLAYYLGFERRVTTGTGSVTGTAVANMNPELYMLVSIDELNNVSQAGMYASGGSQGKVFGKLPIQNNTGQYVFYDKTLTCNEIRPPRARIDRLTVSVRWHDGTLVDFSGAEHSMTLELTYTQTR